MGVQIPEFLTMPMANLVLATSNCASFLSSTWSAWACAPHDLLLVTEASILIVSALKKYPQDGNVGAHCGILLPLSGYRSSILEAPSFAGPVQVIKTINAPLFRHDEYLPSSRKVCFLSVEAFYCRCCYLAQAFFFLIR